MKYNLSSVLKVLKSEHGIFGEKGEEGHSKRESTAEAQQCTRAGLVWDAEGSPVWSWCGEAEGQCRVLLRLEMQTGSRLCLPNAQMTCESCSQWTVGDNLWKVVGWAYGMMSALLLTTVYAAEEFCHIADCDAYLLCLDNQIRWWVDVNYGEIVRGGRYKSHEKQKNQKEGCR